MIHPFREFILNYTYLSESDWNLIEPFLEKQQIQKGENILKQGEVCKNLYFLESGLLRYYILKDGEEVTKYFTQAPYTFTSQESFNHLKPAKDNIQAIENSVIWKISYKDTYELMKIDGWNSFILKLIQEVQSYTENIVVALQTETAEMRYQKMLKNCDPILARVPLKHLASYLGIAPQSLSRIRKKMIA